MATAATPTRKHVHHSVLRFIEIFENRELPEGLRRLKDIFIKISTPAPSISSESDRHRDEINLVDGVPARTQFPWKRVRFITY